MLIKDDIYIYNPNNLAYDNNNYKNFPKRD